MNFFTPQFDLFWGICSAVLGIGLGSFATAVIHRLPRHMSLVHSDNKKPSRSECPHCGAQLRWYDLIPVLSWIMLRGACRFCKNSISPVYPLTELCTAIFCVLCFIIYGYTPITLFLFALSPILISIVLIDARHMVIPDLLNIWGAILAILTAFSLSISFDIYTTQKLFLAMLAGGALYFAVSYTLRLIFLKMRKIEALGLGDVKFFAVAGLWLGIKALPYFMIYAGAFGVLYALCSRKFFSKQAFPFGPALIMALIIMILQKKTVFLTIL